MHCMCAIADQSDAIFTGCVGTVSDTLCLEMLCVLIVLIDFDVVFIDCSD